MSTLPEQKNQIVISPSTITTRQIAKYFDIEIKKLNQIFLELQWIKRKYFLWLVTTELGKEKGAIKEKREILWDREILGDRELIIAIKEFKNESIETDPVAYKMLVYKKYQDDGYTLWDYSKEKGEYNKNIHFVAKKEKDVLLIHCKLNEEDITLEELLTFRKNREDFITENPVFSFYNIKIRYVMPSFLLGEEAFAYLQNSDGLISYELVK
jgi:hypothetical protein